MSAFNALRSSKVVSWKPTGRLQQTLAGCVERSGKALHSGKVSTVRLCPGFAGEGRYFDFRSNSIPASVDFAQVSPLCTTLCKDGFQIRTVEHLLSALEAAGVDNCRIEIENLDADGHDGEIPIFDGSAREWVASVEEAGLKVATDHDGKSCEKIAPHVNEPVYVWRNDSFVAAFPSEVVRITYGICFPQAPAIGCQWFSTTLLDNLVYSKQIALSRTFCIYEEVEQMRNAGLIKGGSLENAIVCRSSVEAEFRAMAQGICESLWMRIILDDLKIKYEAPMRLLCDNKSVISIAHNPIQHDKTKHIEIDKYFIKEKLDNGLIAVEYLPSEFQLADVFTKGLSKEHFQGLTCKLGMIDIHSLT